MKNKNDSVPFTRARRKTQLTLTGHAMQAVAADLPPMGPGLPKEVIRLGASLEIANDREGRAYFTLKGRTGEVLADVNFAPWDMGARRQEEQLAQNASV